MNPRTAGPLGANVIILPHLIMQRKMMKGLRRRIEATARQREVGRVAAPVKARPAAEQPPVPGL